MPRPQQQQQQQRRRRRRRDSPRSKQVVDEDEELLVRHLGISHQENGSEILEASFDVKLGQIVLQVRDAVSFA